MKIKFLNHASFLIETSSEILLCDPWMEGTAFFDGWCLVDQSTSNEKLLNYLLKKNKKVFIWYSHEHSDHFSISFLQILKDSKIKPTIIFQDTIDNRVASYLKKNNFITCIIESGKKFEISSRLNLRIYSYTHGDSYCIIRVGDYVIVNLNDCIIDNEKKASLVYKNIRKHQKKIDILFTQFGYAAWNGNEEDKNIRKKEAKQKLDWIKYQADVMNPDLIIPFASFSFFCHQDNQYMNDEQNKPSNLRKHKNLSHLQNKICFLRPWDEFEIINFKNLDKLSVISKKNEIYWEKIMNRIDPSLLITENKIVDFDELKSIYEKFCKKMNSAFLNLPKFLYYIGIIRTIKVYVEDLDLSVGLSLNSQFKIIDNSNNQDLNIKSNALRLLLEREYGWTSTIVNARLRISKSSLKLLARFFYFQELYKDAITVKNPIKFFCYILKILVKIATRPLAYF